MRLCISTKFGVLLSSDKMAKVKILVVEDEAITANDIQNRLNDLGYDVPAIAASGEGAIKKVEEIEPDLVLMDIVLKGDMDGTEAAEQIRDRFDIPVVYLTVYMDEERLEKTKVIEPYGYIIKPIEDKELRPAIEMALQRHKLEKALRTAEQDWRNLFNSLDDVILITDRDYNIESINEIGLKLLGKSKEDVIGQKCYQVISGVDNPGEECPCRKSLETKKVESLDRYEEIFGKYYSIKSSPIFDENGEIIKFVHLRRDITERMLIMKERDNSYKFLEAVIENIPDPVYLKDSQYRFSLVNQAYCDLFEVKKEEIIRKERVYETDKEIFQTGKAVEIPEQSFTDHKGKRHYTHLKKVPLIDNSGNVTHVLTISRDITERKRREEEREKKNEELRRFNKLAVGRELKMIALKKEINALLEDLGKEPRYRIAGEV